ncbi:MAG: energy transducer TonB [Desulfomonilaceae bacterium]
MATLSNSSAAEWGHFSFLENSGLSLLKLFFRSKRSDADLDSDVDFNLDYSFDSSFQGREANLSERCLFLEDFEPFSDTPVISLNSDLRSWRKGMDIIPSIISTTVHIALIIAIAFSASAGSIGQYGSSPDQIFVKLIDPNALIVWDSGHASLESTASCPSIAKRSKGEKDKNEKETSKKPQNISTETDNGKDLDCDGSSDRDTADEKDIKLAERDLSVPQNPAKRDYVNSDSPSLQDSVASLPSVARAEQRSAAPQGEEADKFKKMVLSAIYKVAYYPKEALHKKEYGEALVSFIVVSDGSIEELTVVKRSGSELLDKAALTIVEKASTRFPAIPEILGHKKINYVVPITFKKRS